MAMTSNFLYEASPGRVAHNSVSQLFVSNPGWLRFMTQYSWPSAVALPSATQKWGSTPDKNRTAFNLALDTDLSFFEYFAKSTETSDQFSAYMKSVHSSHGTSLNHLVSGFDWASLGRATVVDVMLSPSYEKTMSVLTVKQVGGSIGNTSVTLAKAFPDLNFIVQDLPGTIANSKSLLSTQPESVRSRITTQAHDFFTPQPVSRADVYLFRMILHDWPTADAVAILKQILPAMRLHLGGGARIVIMDTVLPPPGSMAVVEEALLRVRDLTMLQAFNSRERELSDFEDLLRQVKDDEGGGLVLRNVVKPPGSVASVMEIVYEGSGKRRDEVNGGT